MEPVSALQMPLQALVLLSGTLVATFLVWYVVGRRDRAMDFQHDDAGGGFVFDNPNAAPDE
jgi:hypothetical protein